MLNKAAMRLTYRMALALDDLPQAEAEQKYEAIAQHDTQLIMNFEDETVTMWVAGEPLFTCMAAYIYGENYRELFASLADETVPGHDHEPQPA